jgi:toxin-antitoxin system PIN domain toxin
MRCVDVNVLVNAHRPEAPHHDAYRDWLDAARSADEPLGLSDLVLSGFLRVVTHPRVFREPTPLPMALDVVTRLRATPNVVPLAPGERHWGIFTSLLAQSDARGHRVPDAYLAAMCIELGATWYSADRDFARFPGLDWRLPVEPS